MLFHAGALWRLNELRFLRKLNRISSVSGGSITAGLLGIRWRELDFDEAGFARNLQEKVIEPLRCMAVRTVDWRAVIGAAFSGERVADRVAKAYDKYLYQGATLQDLPDDESGPRFVINATNVQSGVLWRFMRPYMRDYRVGEIRSPNLLVAVAVAASSAFPPILSPSILKLDEAQYTPDSGFDLQRKPFTTSPVLTDGGVYDNLGLQPAWSFRTVLVSDGGGKTGAVERPRNDWVSHSVRVLSVIDNQVRSLRKRWLIAAYKSPQNSGSSHRDGAYWGIRTDIRDYQLNDTLPCPHDLTMRLAAIPTRLASLDRATQDRLINWGYAVCDAAMRKYVVPNADPPEGFPYPRYGVG